MKKVCYYYPGNIQVKWRVIETLTKKNRACQRDHRASIIDQFGHVRIRKRESYKHEPGIPTNIPQLPFSSENCQTQRVIFMILIWDKLLVIHFMTHSREFKNWICPNPSPLPLSKWFTYSTENSFSLTGLQKTNCIADQILWNSDVSSICITPFSGGVPAQIGASTNDLILVRTISNIDSPQHNLSLVNKSPVII